MSTPRERRIPGPDVTARVIRKPTHNLLQTWYGRLTHSFRPSSVVLGDQLASTSQASKELLFPVFSRKGRDKLRNNYTACLSRRTKPQMAYAWFNLNSISESLISIWASIRFFFTSFALHRSEPRRRPYRDVENTAQGPNSDIGDCAPNHVWP